MKPSTARRLARAMGGIATMAALIATTLRVADDAPASDPLDLVIIVAIVLFAVMGSIIAARRPANPIGWLFVAVGAGLAIDTLLISLVRIETVGSSAPVLVRVADWTEGWTWVPLVFVPTVFPLLLFPEGRLPSSRWRPVVWLAAIGLAAFTFSMAFDPSNYGGTIPIGLRPPAVLVQISGLGAIALIASLIASGIAVVLRFRRSAGEERQQMRWLAYAGAAAAVCLAGGFIGGGILGAIGADPDEGPIAEVLNLLVLLAVLLIPTSMGLAILRYRLYEIDLVIKKTVVFAILVVLVMAGGMALVVGLGSSLAGVTPDRVVSVGTAMFVLGLLVWPLYRISRRVADRIVFRGRASPYEVLTEFSARLSGAYATEDVLGRLANVLGRGTGAAVAVVWIELEGRQRAAAAWPSRLAVSADPPADAVPVIHQGETLGALSVEMPANDPMTSTKRKILHDVAAHAGPVLRNVRLIEDLRESRRRIVAAQDERAKKLERDIHDGAQQQLVALAVKQRLAAALVGKDDRRVRSMLEELASETNETLENLRDLARGIYPPLLADKGLAAALESQTRKSPVPVSVVADGVGRYTPATEAAVYFSTLEALQNVAKYAEASRATVHLAQANGTLTFEVVDDGVGFDPAIERGSGLQGIADRLAALGGEVTIRSAPGDGTTVAGRLPLEVSS